MTSIERTAYPRFKRLITAHELPLFFSPARDELQWAADATDGDEHLLALLPMLKSYQRMGCFPSPEEVLEQAVEFVRRQVELPEGTLPLYRAEVFHNALGVVEIARQLQEEGRTIEPEDLARISPYLTEHINRFGEHSTHELGIQPGAYGTKPDVGFTPLREPGPAAAGCGRAA
ncbi:DUF4158 domain-containing protein [Streptomyces sp. NPDC052701]|uniref:DUF4158 domain-containing protein n=1 Tax=Streptomyces sp. NPDC052701 TaxID=3155533 RepID=UPI0034260FC4